MSQNPALRVHIGQRNLSSSCQFWKPARICKAGCIAVHPRATRHAPRRFATSTWADSPTFCSVSPSDQALPPGTASHPRGWSRKCVSGLGCTGLAITPQIPIQPYENFKLLPTFVPCCTAASPRGCGESRAAPRSLCRSTFGTNTECTFLSVLPILLASSEVQVACLPILKRTG